MFTQYLLTNHYHQFTRQRLVAYHIFLNFILRIA